MSVDAAVVASASDSVPDGQSVSQICHSFVVVVVVIMVIGSGCLVSPVLVNLSETGLTVVW